MSHFYTRSRASNLTFISVCFSATFALVAVLVAVLVLLAVQLAKHGRDGACLCTLSLVPCSA